MSIVDKIELPLEVAQALYRLFHEWWYDTSTWDIEGDTDQRAERLDARAQRLDAAASTVDELLTVELMEALDPKESEQSTVDGLLTVELLQSEKTSD